MALTHGNENGDAHCSTEVIQNSRVYQLKALRQEMIRISLLLASNYNL